ncbi:uncharacterized protein FIBRA_08041 [Fibroporia radiculosa]|uniref:Mannose-6-phosphate isomerase n=1 Tax=Fibroporia radiculosa TaxID=599839 RepID=J4I1Z9_9APHY|nr:uncharacterized protein FIBRA_08041 [Fibroporia radiculosa]CCM05807.1 predicted protein [Fibroporia radiculosa]
MASQAPLIRIKSAIQKYPWGKTGNASLVARLAPNAVGSDFQLDGQKSYAEIWMGTHPHGPAKLYDSPSTSLQSLISTSPATFLGEPVHSKWPGTTQVPFLFKILSIEKALPLQAHPDKELGERLYKEKSDLASDSNHKPEIAVAIGRPLGKWGKDVAFTGFVGFRPLKEIAESMKGVAELREAVGEAKVVDEFVQDPTKERLKSVWSALLKNGAEGRAEKWVEKLAARIKGGKKEGMSEEQAQLISEVEKQYPGDVGVLVTTFFMNFVKLRRGEAIYIGADEVHAYLEGDIIECMAVSDNVVNAAFSPPEEVKSQIPTFLEMLTYTARPASHWNLPARSYKYSVHARTTAYDPPLEEFVVLGTVFHPGPGSTGDGGRKERLEPSDGPTMGIVTRGRVRMNVGDETVDLEEGAVVYVVPGNTINVELLQPDQEGEGEVWWATCVI